MPASVGSYAFGFTWAAVVCLFIASILLYEGFLTGGSRVRIRERHVARRSHSVKSRGSFIDVEGKRRVAKEEL